jgi:hypothetical protein
LSIRQIAKSNDFWILLLAFAGLFACVYLIFHDFGDQHLNISDRLHPEIGRITVRENDVRRKNELQLGWNSVHGHEPVLNKDRIFTGDHSNAVIELKSGSRLKIAPNSMVVISVEEKKAQLPQDAFLNFFKSKPSLDSKTAVQKNPDLSPGAGDSSAESVKITVLSGTLDVQTPGIDGATQSIQANQSVEVGGQGQVSAIENLEISLLAPVAGSSLWLKDDEKVLFEWSASSKNMDFELQVASDADFKKSVFSKKTSTTRLEAILPKQKTYYWRILAVGLGAKAYESVVSLVTVLDNSLRPLPVSPIQDSKFSYTRRDSGVVQGVPIEFTWRDPASEKKFEFEICKERDSDCADPLQRLETNLQKITPAPVAKGNYHWHVRGLQAGRKDPPWSPIQEFSVSEIEPIPDAPVLLSADRKIEWPENHHAEFKWKRASGAIRYNLEISSSDRFLDRVAEPRESEEPNWTWTDCKPGVFYWRVTGINADGVAGLLSQVGRIEISKARAVLSLANTQAADDGRSIAGSDAGSEKRKPSSAGDWADGRVAKYAFEASFGLGATTLQGSDLASGAGAKLLSNSDGRGAFLLRSNWSQQFSPFYEFDFRAVHFQAATSTSKDFNNSTNHLFRGAIGAQSKFGSRFTFKYFAAYEQKMFIHSLNPQTIGIDVIPIPALGGEMSFEAYRQYRGAPTTLGFRLGGSYLLGASTSGYSISAGQSILGGVYLNEKLSPSLRSNLDLFIGYRQDSQNTSLVGGKETTLFTTLSFSLPFD